MNELFSPDHVSLEPGRDHLHQLQNINRVGLDFQNYSSFLAEPPQDLLRFSLGRLPREKGPQIHHSTPNGNMGLADLVEWMVLLDDTKLI